MPFDVAVSGPATSCSFHVAGRAVTADELLVLARAEAREGRRARLETDVARTPFRCFGGAIYTLQRAGFRDIATIAPGQRPE
jgi:hypothetical protein